MKIVFQELYFYKLKKLSEENRWNVNYDHTNNLRCFEVHKRTDVVSIPWNFGRHLLGILRDVGIPYLDWLI